ncbi:MAG: BatA domain-containing protein [Bacteroidota bacterium]
MLQLLQPSWLYMLAGISIPVIIHLWNQRPGRILKVGSISLVPEEAREYKRSLQLSDLLLLLLRCLLIAALALVLSSPNWKKPYTISKQKGWILISKNNFNQTYSRFKTTVDSLYKAGFELHYFNEGFAKEKLEDAVAIQQDSAMNSFSYWKLAETLDATLPAAIPVYIFTDSYLKHFSGNRPTLSFKPHWFTYTASPTIAQHPVESKDTTSLNISIYTDKYSSDTRYIKAAIDAIQSFSKRNIKTTIANNSKQISSEQAWVFWLSDLPLNKEIN